MTISTMSMKTRFVALALATVVMVGAWFMVGFRPAHSRLGELNTQVAQSQAEVTNLRAQLQRLLGLKRQAPELRKRLAKLSTALPTDPKVSAFILQVQDAANLAGIDFLSVAPSLPAAATTVAAPAAPAPAASPAPSSSPAPASPAPSTESAPVAPQAPPTTLRSITMQLTANGKFFEIENFILRLEQLERAVKINTFTLAPGGADTSAAAGALAPGESPSLTSSLSLQVFMVAKPAANPAPAPAAPPASTSSGA